MGAVGAASAIVGLADPDFQCAKALRDRIEIARHLPHLLRVHGRSFTICGRKSHSENVKVWSALLATQLLVFVSRTSGLNTVTVV